MQTNDNTSSLRRQLGLTTAAALIVGEVIGVGIFLTPAGMAKSLGSPFLLLVVWLVMGAMSLCGALCYGELAVRFPDAGGGYVYLRHAYGSPMAFLYGWMALLVMDPGLTALLASGFSSYAGQVVELSPIETKLVGIGLILFLAGANMIGARLGASLLDWLTVLKLGLLALIALLGFGLARGDWSNFLPFFEQRPGSQPVVAALPGVIVAGFFSFAGWWDMSKVAGEIREPQRNLPRALVLGILIVTVAFIVTSAAFLYLVPLEQVTSDEAFAALAGEALFGPAGRVAFAAIVMISVMGGLASVMLGSPRVYYAMARDGVFLPAVARLHPRFQTPQRAIAIQAVLASALLMTGTFRQVLGYFFFIVVLFVGLTVAGLFLLRRRDKSGTGYRTPGYPVTPVVFLLLVVAMLVLLASDDPWRVLAAVAVVALGIPVYYFFFSRQLGGEASSRQPLE